MRHHHDNVRRLVRRPLSHSRRYERPAKVIPLYPRFYNPRPWQPVGSLLPAIAAVLLIAGVLLVALRSGSDVMRYLVPGWPWW
jgi:hypothetical protein